MKHVIFALAFPSQKIARASVQLNDVFIDKPKNNMRNTVYWKLENGKYVGVNVVADEYTNLELLRAKLLKRVNDAIDILVIQESKEITKENENKE